MTIGTHHVRWERPGYAPTDVNVEVTPNRLANARCVVLPTPLLNPTQLGILTFVIGQIGATIEVDGSRVSTTSLKLPAGSHAIVIHRSGFETWTRRVTARPGFPLTTVVQLQPTREHSRERERSKQSRRTWAYWIGGAGLALVGAGVALYAANGSQYQAWQRDRDALSSAIQRGDSHNQLIMRSAQVSNEASTIQRHDDLAVGLGVLGAVGLGYATFSWFTAE